jgi:sialate O-acetylesterase
MGPGNRFTPSGIYNGEIAPLAPFAIRGVVWYQGEHNSTRAHQYRKMLPAFIHDWRRLWANADLPFLVVQLPNFGLVQTDFPRPSFWAEMREAQAMALALPHVSLAVTIDLGAPKDDPSAEAPIHPKNKQDVGHRLTLLAEHDIYGMDVPAWSPSFKSMQIEGDSVRIEFDHAEGLKTAGGGPVQGFALAGEDQKFYWATATLNQNAVVLRADAVKKPVAVRYGWADAPNGNLYNAANLPARPFRTDDWPGISTETVGKL